METAEYISDITSQEVVSDCCGAEIVAEDICSDCREHCDPVEE